MQRRQFLKKGTIIAGLASSANFMLPSLRTETAEHKLSRDSRPRPAEPEEIRSAEFLRRARAEKYLPKPPAIRKVNGAAGVSISPMLLEERRRRGIVPRRGFCSIAPAADAVFISGNGHMNLEMLCDPYSEEILFRHESLLTPIKRPYEAPNIADIFPKVRQMVLDGKYHEAAEFAYLTWHERGAPPGHFTLPAFVMHLDFPRTASVRNPDGTVRDPSIAAALLGIFRNRGPNVELENPDRESWVTTAVADGKAWLVSPNADWNDGLRIAEIEANLLEAAQLVPMRTLPTRTVYLLRAGKPDMPALRSAISQYVSLLEPYVDPRPVTRHW